MKTSSKAKNLKVLSSKDSVSILFSEWFDKVNGNSYYDADVTINGKTHSIAYKYGYNAGDKQSIDEALTEVGVRVRANNKDIHAPYKHITINKRDVLKRELNK